MKAYQFCNAVELGNVNRQSSWLECETIAPIRLAIASAHSWKQRGWAIHRLTTKRLAEDQGFRFTGKLAGHWYPLHCWNFWFAAMNELRRTNAKYLLRFDTDVFNFALDPKTAEDMIENVCGLVTPEPGYISLSEPSTTACCLVSLRACEWIIHQCLAVDANPAAFPSLQHWTDEEIIRELMPKSMLFELDVMASMNDTRTNRFRLYHASRSSALSYPEIFENHE